MKAGCVPGGAWGSPCILACDTGYNATGDPAYPCMPRPGGAAYAGGSLQCACIVCEAALVLPPGAKVTTGGGACAAGGVLGNSCALTCAEGYVAAANASDTATAACIVDNDGAFRYVIDDPAFICIGQHDGVGVSCVTMEFDSACRARKLMFRWWCGRSPSGGVLKRRELSKSRRCRRALPEYQRCEPYVRVLRGLCDGRSRDVSCQRYLPSWSAWASDARKSCCELPLAYD